MAAVLVEFGASYDLDDRFVALSFARILDKNGELLRKSAHTGKMISAQRNEEKY